MKRLSGISVILVLMAYILTGCSGQKLYSSTELYELHDIISYLTEEEVEYQNVIVDSLPAQLGEKMATDMDFIDYLSTRNYDPDKPMVALTFDDGPRTDTTNEILDILEENGAKATFFVVGDNLGSKTEATVKRMASLGCEIGNHTTDHTILTTLDSDEMLQKIDDNNQKIYDMTGRICRLVRPPGGSTNETLLSLVSQPLIIWTIDTRDWESRDAEKIIPIVEEQVTDGAIVLMHDLYESTVEAARTIIPELVEQGYQLVTVSELAYMKGIQLEAGQKYYKFESAE
jgi:peptidoglycan/xylan/chitin deacetylase (PgdA/CDA1 family)